MCLEHLDPKKWIAVTQFLLQTIVLHKLLTDIQTPHDHLIAYATHNNVMQMISLQVLGSLQSRSRAELIAMVLSMQREMDGLREQIRSLTGKVADFWNEEEKGHSLVFFCFRFSAALFHCQRIPRKSFLSTDSFTDNFTFQDHYSLRKRSASSRGNHVKERFSVTMLCHVTQQFNTGETISECIHMCFFCAACGKLAQTLEELIERSDRWLCCCHKAATPSIPREQERSRPPSHISPPAELCGTTAECASSEQQGCGQYEVTQTMPQRNGTPLEQNVRVKLHSNQNKSVSELVHDMFMVKFNVHF